jgi:predicted MFS family arabinose efflux permease/alkylhydroperoxidase family enzyme
MRQKRRMTTAARPSGTRSVATTCFIAVSALAVAMGIGRFAFTPMLPLMVRDGAILPDAGAWLAASNYLGYLAGALVAGRIRLSSPSLMLISLVGTAIATAAIGVSDKLTIWLMLRFAAGAMSAWTLVATSTWALRELTQARRPRLAGLVYSGVGLGIAIVGLFCIAAARPNVPAQDLWIKLGALAATIIAAPALLLVGRSAADRAVASPQAITSSSPGARPSRPAGIVICYGLFGFGYILPATFLPALAREVADDPRLFGLAWPIFGIAAAISTVAVGLLFDRFNRLRLWACSHLLMAAGVVLPTIWLSLETIAIAALLVGGTFMVITMLGLQEARSRSPDNPTTILGRMTAAFAMGQLAGPLTSGALDLLSIDHVAALSMALHLAAIGLVLSAVALLRFSRIAPNERSTALDNSTANATTNSSSTPQGFGSSTAERLPIPARDTMSEVQRHAADAITSGPRKAVFGPFVPLLQCPALMEHVGKTGEKLRFQGCLPEQVREFVICVVARETSNQFEWQMHVPLAIKVGVAQTAIDAIHAGRRPRGVAAELETAFDFASELMLRHGVSDETYAEAVHRFGEPGTVELAALVGYFVMVCWLMNVARTPGPEGARTPPLTAFPR